MEEELKPEKVELKKEQKRSKKYKWECPKCNFTFYTTSLRECLNYKYCPSCGSKFDWNKTFERLNLDIESEEE